MAATLHVYTKNALLYAAQFGVIAGDNSNDRLFGVFCSTDSSVFDASFDRPLKQSTTSGGVTTQTGLLDSGVVQVSGRAFENKWTEWSGNINNPFDFVTKYAFRYNSLKAWKIGSTTEGQGYYGASFNTIAARSVLICMHTGSLISALDPTKSYALFMIDFGQVVTPPSSGFTYTRWLPSVLEMSLA
jgi:hypothetical protein